MRLQPSRPSRRRGLLPRNSNVDDAGGGLLPALGGLLIGVFNSDQQGQAGRRTRTGVGGWTRSKAQKKDWPKTYDSWDKHYEWQYSEQACHQGGGGDGWNVQKVIGDMLGPVGRAVRESG